MPKRLLVIGPEPHEGQLFCAVCVAKWKARLVEVLHIDPEWIKRELDGDQDDAPKVIAPPRGATMPPLEVGVTMAPIGSLGGIGLVCWTHADAFQDVQVMPPPPPGNGQAQRLIPGMS